VYLKLVAEEYVPVENAVNLREVGEQLVAGRAVRGEFLARGTPFETQRVGEHWMLIFGNKYMDSKWFWAWLPDCHIR